VDVVELVEVQVSTYLEVHGDFCWVQHLITGTVGNTIQDCLLGGLRGCLLVINLVFHPRNLMILTPDSLSIRWVEDGGTTGQLSISGSFPRVQRGPP
jgi:hypothetical protein